ncbi:hypothetical protein Bhyg_06353 [Pseudolycoriella hygida]|uniref:Uncharacterized protein n=1 Tax=Pseudolycoriella hygida TaxID=35572 RepID=A0A9Q0S1U2_9DIPT|nr:hypothetical protein Bhyg_06353 [Pseudolycoriella hygida]
MQKMDNIQRCSMMFIILHIFCLNFGVDSLSPMAKPNFEKVQAQSHLDSIYADEPDENDENLPWLKEENISLRPIFGNYDFDEYFEEDLDNYNENTHNEGSEYSYDGDEYEEDESPLSAKKRSRFVPPSRKRTDKHVDLCPYHLREYKIHRRYAEMGFVERTNYTEKVCNHSKTSPDYNKENNRVCYAVGRTFEIGEGTHCFQRTVKREIELQRPSDHKRMIYTENYFRMGCTCGWATDELGPIEDYHYHKILNLCSAIKGKA